MSRKQKSATKRVTRKSGTKTTVTERVTRKGGTKAAAKKGAARKSGTKAVAVKQHRRAATGEYVPNYAPNERAVQLAKKLIKQYGTTLDLLKNA